MKKTLSMLSALILMCSVGLMGCNGSEDEGVVKYTIESFNAGFGNWEIIWEESRNSPISYPGGNGTFIGSTVGDFYWNTGSPTSGSGELGGFVFENTDLGDILEGDGCEEAAAYMTSRKFRSLILFGEGGLLVSLFIPTGTGALSAAYCIQNGTDYTVDAENVIVKKI